MSGFWRPESMKQRSRGFTLLELSLAMSLGLVVITGLLGLLLSGQRSLAVQSALSELYRATAFVEIDLRTAAESAGFSRGTASGMLPDAFADSVPDAGPASDRLVLNRLSRRDCLGQPNDVKDSAGEPEHHLLRTYFVNHTGRLLKRCWYGPPGAVGTRQINASIVDGIEVFRVRFAEDLDGDGAMDRWVDAGGWNDEEQVLAVQVGVVLASTRPVGAPKSANLDLAGHVIPSTDDGKARVGLELILPLKGRL